MPLNRADTINKHNKPAAQLQQLIRWCLCCLWLTALMRMRRWRALTPSTLPGWWSGRGSNRKAGRSQRPHARYPQHILWSHLKNIWIRVMYMIKIVEAKGKTYQSLPILLDVCCSHSSKSLAVWLALFKTPDEVSNLGSLSTRPSFTANKHQSEREWHLQCNTAWKTIKF